MSNIFGSLAPQEDELVPQPRNPAMPADWAQEAVRKVLGGVVNLVMAPRRAMDQGMTTEEAVPWAGDMALTGAGAGAPAAVRGAAGIFGGKLAKTADQAALSRAEEMAAAGALREQIWSDTGWFKGGDNKWRFEIPDNAASMVPGMRGRTIGQNIDHQQLFDAYPSTADIRMLYGEPIGGAAYHRPIESSLERIGISGLVPPKDPSLYLHELQHATQNREGFLPGSNRERAAEDFFDPINKRLSELAKGLHSSSIGTAEHQMLRASYDALMGQKLSTSPTDLYRRTAGEVEARNVQSRMNMTPEERRAKPPWTTEDVPADQQIFGSLAPSGGPQMSMLPKTPLEWRQHTELGRSEIKTDAALAVIQSALKAGSPANSGVPLVSRPTGSKPSTEKVLAAIAEALKLAEQ